ncbi:hypothetical protein BC332_23219 [Capsicum chinense]|nr:hypothetical protein BC332_23219 [Capsicum chinense]
MATSFPMNAGDHLGRGLGGGSVSLFVFDVSCSWVLSDVYVFEELLDEKSPAWNKGLIQYEGASNVEVLSAYVAQFEKDMEMFLDARAQEIVEGGMMVIISPQSSECLVKLFGSSLMDLVYGEIIMARFTNMSCGAMDVAALPLIRGQGFDPGYEKNAVGSAVTLMGPSTHDPN